MSMSTSALGRELGLSSQQTNILLRDEGYLEGEPGNWTLTDKGREHATQQHWDVPSSMHAGYVTTRWDSAVLEDLGSISPARRKEIDDWISARQAELRRQRLESWEGSENISDGLSDSSSYELSNDEDLGTSGKAAGIATALIAGGFLIVRGAKWARPRVENWWTEVAHPKYISAKEKLVAKLMKPSVVRQARNASDVEALQEARGTEERG